METESANKTHLQPDVKPNALGILMEAEGAVGGVVQAYTNRDETEEGWLESWFLRRTGFHYASSEVGRK